MQTKRKDEIYTWAKHSYDEFTDVHSYNRKVGGRRAYFYPVDR